MRYKIGENGDIEFIDEQGGFPARPIRNARTRGEPELEADETTKGRRRGCLVWLFATIAATLAGSFGRSRQTRSRQPGNAHPGATETSQSGLLTTCLHCGAAVRNDRLQAHEETACPVKLGAAPLAEAKRFADERSTWAPSTSASRRKAKRKLDRKRGAKKARYGRRVDHGPDVHDATRLRDGRYRDDLGRFGSSTVHDDMSDEGKP